MLNRILISVLFVASASYAGLWEEDSQYFLNAGASLSSYTSSGSTSPGNRTGMLLGGGIEYLIRPGLSFVGELNYVQKGAKEGSMVAKFDYIEVPLLLKVHFPQSGMSPFICGGAAYGMVVTKSVQIGDASFDASVSKSEASLQLGAGVQFPFTRSTAMSISARYSYGLTNLLDVSNASVASSKHRAFFIVATWVFGSADRYDNIESRARDYLDSRKSARETVAAPAEAAPLIESTAAPVLEEEKTTEPASDLSLDDIEPMGEPVIEPDLQSEANQADDVLDIEDLPEIDS